MIEIKEEFDKKNEELIIHINYLNDDLKSKMKTVYAGQMLKISAD